MPWVRIDDEFPHHPKVTTVGPFGVALQVAALCYCNHFLTDGFLPFGAVRTLLDFNRLGENIGDQVEVWVELGAMNIAGRLVKAGIWEEVEGGFRIHDYRDYQPSRVEVEAEREKNRDRVAKHRANKRNKGRNASSNAITNADVRGAPVPVPVPPIGDPRVTSDPIAETDGVNTLVEQARPIDDTTAVFQAWQEAARKPRAKLDDKRRRIIRAALKHYPLADVVDAVRGWQVSPHHRGENDQRTVYNDLGLLLRDSAHIENFRDLWRDGPLPVMGKHTTQTVAFARQMATMRPAKEVTADDVGRVDGDRALAQRQLSRPEG